MILLTILGIINFTGFVIHLLFTPIWGWGGDLKQLKSQNRRAALTMNGMITYLFGFFSVVNLLWAFGVLEIQKTLVISIIGFWVVRSILQLLYYRVREPLSLAFLGAFIFMIAGHIVILL